MLLPATGTFVLFITMWSGKRASIPPFVTATVYPAALAWSSVMVLTFLEQPNPTSNNEQIVSVDIFIIV